MTEATPRGRNFIRDLVAGTTRMVSINQAGTGAGNGYSDYWQVTPDGRYVAFGTADDLLPADTNGTWDVYIRDLVTNGLELVSATPGGAAGTGSRQSAGPA